MSHSTLFIRTVFVDWNTVYEKFPELMDDRGAEVREFQCDLERRLASKFPEVGGVSANACAREMNGVRIVARSGDLRVGIIHSEPHDMIGLLVISDSQNLTDACAKQLFDEIAAFYGNIRTGFGLWNKHLYQGDIESC